MLLGFRKILSISTLRTRQEQTDHHWYSQLVTTLFNKTVNTILGCDELTM